MTLIPIIDTVQLFCASGNIQAATIPCLGVYGRPWLSPIRFRCGSFSRRTLICYLITGKVLLGLTFPLWLNLKFVIKAGEQPFYPALSIACAGVDCVVRSVPQPRDNVVIPLFCEALEPALPESLDIIG